MFYNIFALGECINKKIHAIFHRASKQFKVDAATSHVGMAVLFSLLYPPSGAAVGMAAIFPLLYPPSNAAVGMTTLFPLLYPLSSDTVGMAALFLSCTLSLEFSTPSQTV